MKYLITIIFISLGVVMHSQLEITAYHSIYSSPQFPKCKGGTEQEQMECTKNSIRDFIDQNLQIPNVEIDPNIIPRVWVYFNINEKGNIESLQIKKRIHPKYDREALRIINSLPKFTKGHKGVYLVPIYFGSVDVNVEDDYSIKKSEIKKETSDSLTTSPPSFERVEIMPSYPGCEESKLEDVTQCTGYKVQNFIVKNVNYPEECLNNNITGKVWVYYEIGPQGKVQNVKVMKGVHPLLDAESEWVIKHLPVHTPGMQMDKNVTVKYTIPLNFKIG